MTKMYDGALSELIFIRTNIAVKFVLKSKYLDLSCWQQKGRIRRKKKELTRKLLFKNEYY